MAFSSLSILKTFVTSGSAFKIVYTTSNGPIISNITKRVLVLDSSFNPPHFGHATLVKKSILYHFPDQSDVSVSTINTKSVLLLLSLKNADKKTADLGNYSLRLDMIQLLASHISEDYGIACSIGLTTKSLFTEKISAINQEINKPQVKFTFLLGFDTLVRLFDPKYYPNQSISSALKLLFANSSFFILSRNDEKYPQEEQEKYIEKIERGEFKNDIPSEWTRHLFLVRGDGTSLNISSSEIRAMINGGQEKWKKYTYADIIGYITDHNMYV